MSSNVPLCIMEAFKSGIRKCKPPGLVLESVPQFDQDVLIDLCKRTVAVLRMTPTVVHLKTPISIVGDLHGSLHDLATIFCTTGYPPDTHYLFLGDYVDRGAFSIEVVTFLFALLCTYPDSVTLLRGNHEFRLSSMIFTFRDDVLRRYPPAVANGFLEAFSWLPLAAVIDDQTFCVHGGIPEKIDSLNEIASIQRPIVDITDKLVEQLLWGDPSKFGTNNSSVVGRGHGYVFSARAVDNFYEKTKLSCIIRGHEYVETGITMNERMNVVTIYSAGACMKKDSVKTAVLVMKEDGEAEPLILDVPFVDAVPLVRTRPKIEVRKSTSNPVIPEHMEFLEKPRCGRASRRVSHA